MLFYSAPQLRLSRLNSSYNPSGLFASGGFLQAALAPIPTWFLKASIHPCWCCFSCNTMQWTAFGILLMPTHIPFTPFSWGTPFELVFLDGYPHSNSLTDSFTVFLFREVSCFLHPCGLILGHHSSFKYRYKSFKCAFNEFNGPIQESSQDWSIVLFYFTSDAWPAQLTHFSLGINVPDFCSMSFEPIYSGVCLVSASAYTLGESIETQFGWWDEPITHTWFLLSFPCSNVSFWFGTFMLMDSFYLVLQARLCHSHELHFVLRDTDQTIPLHEYLVHCCQPLLFCSMSGTIFLSRSTVSLVLSFTLNQAAATTSHSIMPSRRNSKLTYLGFVRGCLISWLYWSGSWFYDSWNGLSSSSLQNSSGHFHLSHCKFLVWCLPIILIHETYHLLSSTSLWVLQPSAHHAQDTP